MKKLIPPQSSKRKPYIILGILLLVVAIGAGGCGSSGSSGSSQAASSQQTNQGQSAQGQPSQGQRQRNPALLTAMEIRRLQSDSQMALTSDQKAKIKPILQTLIDTANPSQDFLQQQADAISAVFTDQQKNFLTTRPNGNNGANGNTPNRNRPNGNNSSGNNSNGNSSGGNGANGNSSSGNSSSGNSQKGNNSNGRNNQNGRSMQPKDIYQQILNSLN